MGVRVRLCGSSLHQLGVGRGVLSYLRALSCSPNPWPPQGEREGQNCALDPLKDLDYSSESLLIKLCIPPLVFHVKVTS